MPYKSQRMGLAIDSEGARTTAYRACMPLVCVQCTRGIPPGHVFSRRSQQVTWPAMGAVTTAPVCIACRPLQMEGDTDGSAPLVGKQDG